MLIALFKELPYALSSLHAIYHLDMLICIVINFDLCINVLELIGLEILGIVASSRFRWCGSDFRDNVLEF